MTNRDKELKLWVLGSLRIISFTSVSGKTSLNMEEESRSGLTAPFMKDIGKVAWPMAKEDLFMKMVRSMRANG